VNCMNTSTLLALTCVVDFESQSAYVLLLCLKEYRLNPLVPLLVESSPYVKNNTSIFVQEVRMNL